MRLQIQKLDLATGRREDVMILRPGELTGGVQIVQAAFTGDGKSYAYAVRRMASHLFLVGRGSRAPRGNMLTSQNRSENTPVIDLETFNLVKHKHGGYASWAVWASPTRGPKSDVGDLRIFDLAANPTTLETLNNNVVMVGLNISRPFTPFTEPFRNFHDSNPNAQDFKIRHAFAGTPYYGAYMTDVIKNTAMGKSSNLRNHLRKHPELAHSNISTFREELRDLRCQRPTILAFGADAHSLLAASLLAGEYASLIRLTHYSHRIGKQDYRAAVLAQIASQIASPTQQPTHAT